MSLSGSMFSMLADSDEMDANLQHANDLINTIAGSFKANSNNNNLAHEDDDDDEDDDNELANSSSSLHFSFSMPISPACPSAMMFTASPVASVIAIPSPDSQLPSTPLSYGDSSSTSNSNSPSGLRGIEREDSGFDLGSIERSPSPSSACSGLFHGIDGWSVDGSDSSGDEDDSTILQRGKRVKRSYSGSRRPTTGSFARQRQTSFLLQQSADAKTKSTKKEDKQPSRQSSGRRPKKAKPVTCSSDMMSSTLTPAEAAPQPAAAAAGGGGVGRTQLFLPPVFLPRLSSTEHCRRDTNGQYVTTLCTTVVSPPDRLNSFSFNRGTQDDVQEFPMRCSSWSASLSHGNAQLTPANSQSPVRFRLIGFKEQDDGPHTAKGDRPRKKREKDRKERKHAHRHRSNEAPQQPAALLPQVDQQRRLSAAPQSSMGAQRLISLNGPVYSSTATISRVTVRPSTRDSNRRRPSTVSTDVR